MLSGKISYDKFLLLFVTGAPGLFKVVNLIILKNLYNDEEISGYLNDIFISQITLIFTGISWSTILLADLNKIESNKQFSYFQIISTNALLYFCCMSGVLWALAQFGYVVDFMGSCIYLLMTTMYQLCRMFLIGQRKYLSLTIAEILILLLSFINAYLFYKKNWNLLFGQSICFIPLLFYVFMKEKDIKILRFVKLSKVLNVRALFNSLTNASTSGVYLYFTPLAFQFLTPAETNAIGMISYASSILILIPRSFSYAEVLKMAKVSQDRIVLRSLYSSFERKNLIIISLLLIISLFIVFAYYNYGLALRKENDGRHFLVFVCILMIISALASQLVLPVSNLFMVKELEKEIFWVNTFSLVLFAFLFCISKLVIEDRRILYAFQVLLVFSHFFRFYKLKRRARKCLI